MEQSVFGAIQIVVEKDWLDITKIILTGAIAGILALIAWMQYIVNRQRLQHERHEAVIGIVESLDKIDGFIYPITREVTPDKLMDLNGDLRGARYKASLLFGGVVSSDFEKMEDLFWKIIDGLDKVHLTLEKDTHTASKEEFKKVATQLQSNRREYYMLSKDVKQVIINLP